MKVGRLQTSGVPWLVVVSNSSELFDWSIFEDPAVPTEIRTATAQTRLAPTNSNFCAALLLLEQFLREHPGFLATRSARAIKAEPGTRFESPVTPQNLICVGLNYRDHAAETGMKIPDQPLLFAKTANALTGHNFSIPLPCGTTQIDYEAELVVVIGRQCHRATPEDALSYVAGYTCGNDVSARDFQFGDGQWYRGKSLDGFAPIGPWLVTPSEVGDPHRLRIALRLNGKIMQDSTTANLIFGIPQLVSHTSCNITLMPGDVIMTGTPPGVGFTRKPPVFLNPGDTMEVEIEKLGTLVNQLASAS